MGSKWTAAAELCNSHARSRARNAASFIVAGPRAARTGGGSARASRPQGYSFGDYGGDRGSAREPREVAGGAGGPMRRGRPQPRLHEHPALLRRGRRCTSARGRGAPGPGPGPRTGYGYSHGHATAAGFHGPGPTCGAGRHMHAREAFSGHSVAAHMPRPQPDVRGRGAPLPHEPYQNTMPHAQATSYSDGSGSSSATMPAWRL